MFTVIIPAANEEKRISATVHNLLVELPRDFHLLVVSNSTDGTARIVKKIAASNKRVKLLEFKRKLGKGRAIVEGLKAVRTGSAAFYDADGSAPARELIKLAGILREGKSDVVIGSRWLPQSHVSKRPLKRRIASKMCTWLVRSLFGMHYADTQCGCKALSEKARRWAIRQNWQTHGFEWDVELLWKASEAGLKITETPITWHEQPGGTAKNIDALRIAGGLVKLRLNRNGNYGRS